MRTKALLCAAAVAAGALTSMAQSNVYSLNIVGYVNTPIAAGFNLIANPLDNGTNTLDSLFTAPGFGDIAYKFVAGSFTSSQYLGSWTPSLTLVPGEGVFYLAGGPFTNTFVGNVMIGNLTNNLPAGFSFASSQVPQADTLGNLGFTPGFGDLVYYFRGGVYVSSQYLGTWNPDLTVGVGEAFWALLGAPVSWTRTFNP